jgi:hypothetical protein
MKLTGAAVLLVAAGAGLAGCAGSQAPTTKRVVPPATLAVPAWAAKCMPQGSQRLGPARRYVGLTPSAANRLDEHSSSDLVYAGGGGRCSTFNDDVYRRHPIAVVISTRLIGTPGARIVAAARAVPGWEPGARKARTIHYQLEGITLAAAPSGYRPGVSRARVLMLFRKSGLLDSGAQSRPSIHLWAVGDGRPADGGSPSWVLTFRHTIPTSLGVPKTPVCTTVAIYDLRVGVWTWDFQNCGAGKRASCDAGCTPANQPALDAAATYAETVAGAAHVYAGDRVDDAANQVVVYLVHAPESVLAELRARHPGIYVIHNDAPRTWHAVTQLQKSLDFRALKSKGIDLVSSGPTGTGYLQVGVSSSVAKAQAYFDAKYGRGVVRVEHAEPVTLDDGGPVVKHPIQGAVAVRSTRSQEANAAEVRQWRKRPIAVFTNGDESIVRFVLPGDGCKPTATAARIAGTTLTLLMRRGSGCTLIARFYEVTVSLAKPVLGQGLRNVVARYGTSGKPQQMRLAEVVYG